MSFDLSRYIKTIPNFPKNGVMFKDISPLLENPKAFSFAVREIRNRFAGKIDAVAGLDARGFIFGGALAFHTGIPFIMLRKAGKLPGKTISLPYDLEYGTAVLEVEESSIALGSRVLIIDDLLATGGTSEAACKLVLKAGAKVAGCAFIVELASLGGRKKLPVKEILSLVVYEE